MGPRIVQVDAFTDRPFRGNPAAVCVLDSPADDAWMQDVAREMNLSETAFLHPEGDGHRLRWFTPAIEVDLCGHATLAAAHVLWEDGHLPLDATARFFTRSGLLAASKAGDWISMDFPAHQVTPAPMPMGLTHALGVTPTFVARTPFDLLAVVESEAKVRELTPDLGLLGAIPARGIIVTARSEGSEHDFASRFFAPRVGIAEDPVTGSAHCALGRYWGERLGKRKLVGYQASARGGLVKLHWQGDRVILSGQAVTTLRGNLAQDARPGGIEDA